MSIIILKFGGTSLNTIKKREKAAAVVATKLESGYFPVVVVSAMGRAGDPYSTDSLLQLVSDSDENMKSREKDLLQSCGEIISAVVFSKVLNNSGYRSRALTGAQAGILTDSNYGDAGILNIDPSYLVDLCREKIIPVIAGFQGHDIKGEITTLGRGGSDTSAGAIAVAMKAEMLEIYTDVEGIKTADPAKLDHTYTISELDYQEVIELAYKGAKVIHPRAVEIAAKAKIPIKILSPGSDQTFSLIHDFDHDNPVTVLTTKENIAFIRIKPSRIKQYATGLKIFSLLSTDNISVDFINIRPGEISFVVDINQIGKVKKILNSHDFDFKIQDNFIKLSAVGSGMTGKSGILSKILNLMSQNNICIYKTTDSHMTISLLILKDDQQLALNVLHKNLISKRF